MSLAVIVAIPASGATQPTLPAQPKETLYRETIGLCPTSPRGCTGPADASVHGVYWTITASQIARSGTCLTDWPQGKVRFELTAANQGDSPVKVYAVAQALFFDDEPGVASPENVPPATYRLAPGESKFFEFFRDCTKGNGTGGTFGVDVTVIEPGHVTERQPPITEWPPVDASGRPCVPAGNGVFYCSSLPPWPGIRTVNAAGLPQPLSQRIRVVSAGGTSNVVSPAPYVPTAPAVTSTVTPPAPIVEPAPAPPRARPPSPAVEQPATHSVAHCDAFARSHGSDRDDPDDLLTSCRGKGARTCEVFDASVANWWESLPKDAIVYCWATPWYDTNLSWPERDRYKGCCMR